MNRDTSPFAEVSLFFEDNGYPFLFLSTFSGIQIVIKIIMIAAASTIRLLGMQKIMIKQRITRIDLIIFSLVTARLIICASFIFYMLSLAPLQRLHHKVYRIVT